MLDFDAKKRKKVRIARQQLFNTVEHLKIMKENKVKNHRRDEYGVPSFTITKKLNITAFYDDETSLFVRTKMYAENEIKALSFWRIGQEDPDFWKWIIID